MNMPKITKKEEKNHAEKVLRKKVDEMAELANTPDEIRAAQEMSDRQVRIEGSIKKTIFGLSPDTFASCACNIGGILLVSNYEHLRVLTGKAWGFIHKGRLH